GRWGCRSRRDRRSRLQAWQRDRRPRTLDFRLGLLHSVAKRAGIELPQRKNWTRDPPVQFAELTRQKQACGKKVPRGGTNRSASRYLAIKHLRGPGTGISPGDSR